MIEIPTIDWVDLTDQETYGLMHDLVDELRRFAYANNTTLTIMVGSDDKHGWARIVDMKENRVL